MSKIFLFLVTVLLSSCTTRNHSLLVDIEVSNNAMNVPDSIKKKHILANIVNRMESIDVLGADYVDFQGRKFMQEDFEVGLIRFADTTFLKRLTDHSNPIVRVVAFRTLATLKYSGLKVIFRNHLYDHQFFKQRNGSRINSFPVNISFYGLIYDSLSKKEKTEIENKLKERYKMNYVDFYLYDRQS